MHTYHDFTQCTKNYDHMMLGVELRLRTNKQVIMGQFLPFIPVGR